MPAGICLSALAVIMLFLLVVPTFYVSGLYEDSSGADIESDHDSLINLIRTDVRNAYQIACEKGKETADELFLLSSYPCSENRENVMKVRIVNIDMEETDISTMAANDMIATYNALLNFNGNADEIIRKIKTQSKDVFLNDISKYCRNMFYVYAVSEEKAEKKAVNENEFYHEVLYNVAIGRNEQAFLNTQVNDSIDRYAREKNVSRKNASIAFHLLKEGYVQTLNEMSGLGSGYPFVRERIVRNFVNNHSESQLKKYHCTMALALKKGGYSSYYGMRPNGTIHKGLDIAIAEGTDLHAINIGIVVQSDYDPNRGNTYRERINSAGNVLLVYYGTYEGNYVFYLYAHLSGNNVKTGDEVEANQIIGKTGNTGYSTGPHLHWEVVLMNIQTKTVMTVDPLGYCH